MGNKLTLVHLQLSAVEAKQHISQGNKVKSRFYVNMANNLMELMTLRESQRKEVAHG